MNEWVGQSTCELNLLLFYVSIVLFTVARVHIGWESIERGQPNRTVANFGFCQVRANKEGLPGDARMYVCAPTTAEISLEARPRMTPS